jgi:protease IV
VEDDRVRAILFRVDSPGGSYVASDVVRRELARAQEEGKPVVVSMGNVAASGGYLVSLEADRIVAHPTTLTGSIGVLAGKFVTRDLWERLGIQWERIEAGGESTFFSPIDDFSEEEWERFQDYLDRVYDEFVGLVAEGRGMEIEAVDAVARGRVWTGVDALDRGLVDELGGFSVAVAAVREALELEPDQPIDLATFPAERTLFQLLMEDGWRTGVAAWVGGGAVEGEFMRVLRPVWSLAAETGLLGDRPGPVRMPPVEIPLR